jgi:hypothetical protein
LNISRADLAVVCASLVIALLVHVTIRWVTSDPLDRDIEGRTEIRLIDTPGFLGWGLAFLASSLFAISQLARDRFFLRPGELNTLTVWHGLPWPLLVWLMAGVSPLWLLALFTVRYRDPGPLRRIVTLVAWLLGLGYPALWILFTLPSWRS